MPTRKHHVRTRGTPGCKRLLLWFTALVFACTGTPASAQKSPCDPQLTPTADGVGYLLRKDRCEGLYVSPVSVRGGVELVSLTRGRLEYQLGAGQHLTLEAASKGLPASDLQVRGVATPLRTYYRMDTRLSAGERWQWPVDDVLLPLQLTAERLGIFAWAALPSGKVFVPLRVNRSVDDDIHLRIRPTAGVQEVIWRMIDRQLGRQRATPWQRVATEAQAGETIPILFSPTGRQTLVEVEVAAVVESGGWAKLRIKVWNE
jgi:hypothetical protein